MSEFIYLIRGGEMPESPEQTQKRIEKWLAWMDELGANGNIKDRGCPLEEKGKVVSGKNKTVSDGAFAAENNEDVGRYMLVEAEDLPQATEIAKDCPIFEVGGSVEVRPIQKIQI